MAVIKPFKGIRPVEELAEKVAALPYDVMTREEAENLVEGNPLSFLRVDRAEIELPREVPFNHSSVYERAAYNLEKLMKSGVLKQDSREVFYIYQLEVGGRRQSGLVACFSIDDYLSGVIKKHEHTTEDKEKDRIRHVKACNAHTGPILLFNREDVRVNQVMESWMKGHKPVYDFSAQDNVEHRVWVIDETNVIYELKNLFSGIDKLYIADGHHRCAAAVKVGLDKRKGVLHGDEEYNYFLGVVFPHNQLRILDYNRVVRDLNGLSVSRFLDRVSLYFDINPIQNGEAYKPGHIHSFGMFVDGGWYELIAKPGTWNDEDPVERLDVRILQNNLLGPILGIEDPRKDKRIEFVGGSRRLIELENMVRQQGEGAAFALYPTSIVQLMDVADMGKIMPPKSTWFEPKLRSGLFIHDIG
ncbi:MAG: hypothetical protein HPY66_0812 [Firmicutes bacterium]|nr:hypothetical protein [Bacillota bacterium]MDI6705555.1 DUF1015 family protein [Bacillota bacterium]